MEYLNQPGPLHPLITIMKYDEENTRIGNPGDRISLDFYKISFKTRFSGKIGYGQSYYDFKDGGMAFLAAGPLTIHCPWPPSSTTPCS